jgi:hydrogenase nickel incorporation protein HypB
MFNTCRTMILNKIDLLPYLDYDMDELMANLAKVNPGMKVIRVSATRGEGMDELIEHISLNVEKKLKAPQ